MAVSEKAILTVLCMIYHDNYILLQDRVKEDWRGLTIYNPQLCGIKQFPTGSDERYVVLLFKTNQFSGELCSSYEGEMVWVNRDDLANSPIAEGFFDTLKVFDDMKLTELFYEHKIERKTSGHQTFTNSKVNSRYSVYCKV